MRKSPLFLFLVLFFLFIVPDANAQVLHVRYKKFIVPGQTEYGRWMSSPAMKRQMREREERMANYVSEYYDLYTDGKTSYFKYDTTISKVELDEMESRWWRRMGSAKESFSKDLRTGNVTIRSNALPDSICRSRNFNEDFNWQSGEGLRVFSELECNRVQTELEQDSVVAWYAPAIPIKDGPEFFGGAPGVILAVEAKSYNFIAQKVEYGDFDIPAAPVAASECIDKKTFQEKMREAMMKEFLQND